MPFLKASATPLVNAYDVAMLDLDGVVYVGQGAVPAAPAALSAARDAGMRLAFVTNNAARPPAAVVDHLVELGIPAAVEEVITSAQTAAHYLARKLPPGAPVLVVGTTGLIEALQEQGLTPVFSADDKPVAVVQGYSPELNWRQLAEAMIAIRAGARWVATNLDATVPSPRGPLPGNGSLVAALRHATGIEPFATGKPDPTMHAETVERTNAQRPIVVGDRLDTDIEGATRVGCASLIVFSGVTDPSLLLAAPAGQRPDYLADDLAGLLTTHPAVAHNEGATRCGHWSARRDGNEILLSAVGMGSDAGGAGEMTASPDGSVRAEQLDALRALCELAWTTGNAPVRAEGKAAGEVLEGLALVPRSAG
ncbi:MAG: family hydrolase [Pseudonocardiales bacterium]|nr:family hydrolase [Pseudonocardiales bacterium]